MLEHGVEPYVGADRNARCPWCYGDALYEQYHDTEWGVPVHEDRLHFEFLLLEAFQAGLSWLTVLRKRERFRERFAGFEPTAVASLTDAELEEIRQDPGIIRNKAKIRAARTNAQAFLHVCSQYGSFDRFIWNYVDGRPVINRPVTLSDVPATTPLSDRVSADLKKLGFTFVGSTMVYAHLQATGVVNDHLAGCFRAADTNA